MITNNVLYWALFYSYGKSLQLIIRSLLRYSYYVLFHCILKVVHYLNTNNNELPPSPCKVIEILYKNVDTRRKYKNN